MEITILSLFPKYFDAPLAESILARAAGAGVVKFKLVDIRQFTSDPHRTTDDRPFGGGPGMVMKVEPIALALESLQLPELGTPGHKRILTSAKGRVFTQQLAQEYSALQSLTIVCGHYEGVDERVAEHLIDEEVRIGDYVLTGGEPAALVIADAVTRLLPGALGNDQSTSLESHTEAGMSGFPQYTRPEEFRGWTVPPVLLSGHHAEITRWRQAQRKQLDVPNEK